VKTVPRRGYIFDGPIEEVGFDADVLSTCKEQRTVLPSAKPAQPKRSGVSVLSFPSGASTTCCAQLTSFVGRAEELVEVIELLRTERL
jgi:hypothetical protein